MAVNVVPRDPVDDGNDVLTHIAVLTSLRTMLDDTIWEVIAEARKEDISLRRISRVAQISPTHLKRRLDGWNPNPKEYA